MVMTLFLQPLRKLSTSCLFRSIFVLEPKAHAMNYNHSKELSTNKTGVVTGKKRRARHLTLGLRHRNKQRGFVMFGGRRTPSELEPRSLTCLIRPLA